MDKSKTAHTPGRKFKRYRYGTRPDMLPVDWESEPSFTVDEIRSAGFDPNDNEAGFGTLTAPWMNHAKGARVLSGLTQVGHPFAVEVTQGVR